MGATQSIEEPHILKTSRGSLKGVKESDQAGKAVCYRYLKVPFAQAPVGKLRWRRPQPLAHDFRFSTSDDKPGDHTSFGAICPQPLYALADALVGNPNTVAVDYPHSEDCLFMNIWVPAGEAPAEGWPIQFDIHGGWHQVGKPMQTSEDNPFNLLADGRPRIIVAAAYRLNLFGYLAGAQLSEAKEDTAAGNYGLWDQRCALEWVANNISLFGGNPKNITVGGLSAGANSTFYQLYYDAHQPEGSQLINNAYLRSNAVAIQPNKGNSSTLTEQFNELCSVNDISPTLSYAAKLDALRALPDTQITASIHKMKMHTARVCTDDDFVPSEFLSRVHNGQFATLLAKRDVHVFIGEVSEERLLYKLINPPKDHLSLVPELVNYYPPHVVEALLPLYDIPPPTETDPEKWADIFSRIVGDVQVHAAIRGFAKALLDPPAGPGIKAMSAHNVHRYRIEWRAPCLDEWLKPEVEVCHAADNPIWWASGWRAGFTDDDKSSTLEFLRPFDQMLYGEVVEWGIPSGQTDLESMKTIRVLRSDGSLSLNAVDLWWDHGMKVCDAIWQVQTMDGSAASSAALKQDSVETEQGGIKGLVDKLADVAVDVVGLKSKEVDHF